MPERLKVIKPRPQPETDSESAHRLELRVEGEMVAFAELHYHNDVFPVYYVSVVFTRHGQRSKGYGGDMMEKINTFLTKNGKAGLLFDAIEADDVAKGFYRRHGWQPATGDHRKYWYSFRLPENLDSNRLDRAIHEINRSERKRIEKEERGLEARISRKAA
ncbi:GNAT family N-acetyltransferase [Candidatus Uhrbacteria bacterium]|nr:GNAT family N-acetyltransferase [Candidatus Uhrbacteria bacterium]